jgi:hypothetical protein
VAAVAAAVVVEVGVAPPHRRRRRRLTLTASVPEWLLQLWSTDTWYTHLGMSVLVLGHLCMWIFFLAEKSLSV